MVENLHRDAVFFGNFLKILLLVEFLATAAQITECLYKYTHLFALVPDYILVEIRLKFYLIYGRWDLNYSLLPDSGSPRARTHKIWAVHAIVSRYS